MPSFPRSELEEMMKRWAAAHDRAEAEAAWGRHLGGFYADDAEYRVNLGPNRELRAVGRAQIVEVALGSEMAGFEGWHYPYERVLIDEQVGQVVAFYRQIAPYRRADGSPYELAGTCGSLFTYAGNFAWRSQLEWLDVGNAMALLLEIAADGHLPPTLARRVAVMARGGLGVGHRALRSDGGAWKHARGVFALTKAAWSGARAAREAT